MNTGNPNAQVQGQIAPLQTVPQAPLSNGSQPPVQTPDHLKANAGAALNELLSEVVSTRPVNMSAAEAILVANRTANPLELIPDLPGNEPRQQPVQSKVVSEPVPVKTETQTPPSTPTPTPEIPLVPDASEPTPLADEVTKSLADNYKELKQTYKKTKDSFKLLEEQKTELENKVKAYETGEVQPEIVAKLSKRVAELEPLESLVNFKKTEAYRQKFVEPLNAAKTKLQEYADTYGVPAEILEDAAQITDQRRLNAFLLDHFDDLGAREVKDVILDLHKTKTELNSFEKRPQDFYEKITEEHALLKQRDEEERLTKLNEIGKGAWTNSLLRIRQEGKVQELIPREGDEEFNSKWVKPIQEKASHEFGKLLSGMHQSGLKTVNPELMEALATAALLTAATPTAIARANAAEARLAELEANIERDSRMQRPSVGAVGTGSRGGTPQMQIPSQERTATKTMGHQILADMGIPFK